MKKKKTQRRQKAIKLDLDVKVPFFLILIILVFIFSLISTFSLLVEKLDLLFSELAPGVLITCLLLFVYIVFLIASLYFIFSRKKHGMKSSIATIIIGLIFLVWYSFLGVIFFYQGMNKVEIMLQNLPAFLINFVILCLVLVYFLKSKNLRKILVR